jgi:hypothetical protein
LLVAPSSEPDGASDPPSVSQSNRRAYRRLSVRECEWLRTARVKYGPDVRVIDVSAGGLALETKHALKPDSSVVFELTGATSRLLVPARVVRSQIVSLNGIALYRSGCAFKSPIELSRLRSEVSGPPGAFIRFEVPGDSVQIDLALPSLLERCRAFLDADDVIASLELLLIEASGRADPIAHTLAELVSRVLSVLKRRQPTASILAELEALHRRTMPPVSVHLTDAPSTQSDPRLRRSAGYLVELLHEWNRFAGNRQTPRAAQISDAPSRRLVPAFAPSWQKVVVRYRDGRILRGYTCDFNVSRPQFHFSLEPVSGDSLMVPLTQLKALFFVRDFAGDPTYKEQKVFTAPPQGRTLEVTFDDGEVLLGSTLSYQPEAHGFIVHPADKNGNNIRVFVSSAAVRHVQFVARPSEFPRRVADDAPRGGQAEMRGAVVNGSNGPTPIDMTGMRRAPRFKIVEGTEVQIDGEAGTLVNLSVVGAQVCSVVALTPKQRVSVVFDDGGQSMCVHSVVASVSAQIADGSTRYLAGIEFLDVDQSALQRLIDSKKK